VANGARRTAKSEQHLVAAALRTLKQRKKRITPQAIAAYLSMPDIYTIERVSALLDHLKRDGRYDRIICEAKAGRLW
jgi:hypothetical protein